MLTALVTTSIKITTSIVLPIERDKKLLDAVLNRNSQTKNCSFWDSPIWKTTRNCAVNYACRTLLEMISELCTFHSEVTSQFSIYALDQGFWTNLFHVIINFTMMHASATRVRTLNKETSANKHITVSRYTRVAMCITGNFVIHWDSISTAARQFRLRKTSYPQKRPQLRPLS